MSPAEAAAWLPDADLEAARWGALAQPVVERAARAHDAGLMPHAVLLVGPPHLGRELAAVELAALLTCPEHGGPGCECGSCRRVRRGVHPDVQLVSPAGTIITIAQIREVVAAAPGRPYEGVGRVWILEGVEAGQLGREAANAFLKTLEEPASHVHFILLAGNPEAVLPTVRSRCQQLVLPGPLAVARALGEEVAAPALAGAALAGRDPVDAVAVARSALASGEVLQLVRAARALGDLPDGYQAAAAAALELATEDGQEAPELGRLAGELLAAEGRARALNLSAERQILACLLTWYQRG